MIRGTTPIHTFELPFDTSICKEIKITYAQNDKVILEKKSKSCNLEGNTVTLRLTQEETFKFDCKKLVQIQLRVLTTNDEVLASDIALERPDKCLDSEVLV